MKNYKTFNANITGLVIYWDDWKAQCKSIFMEEFDKECKKKKLTPKKTGRIQYKRTDQGVTVSMKVYL